MKPGAKAHLALLFTNIFFAINFTAVKFLVNAGLIKPFGLNLLRVGISTVLLWILFMFKPVKSVIQRKDYGRLFLCALTGVAINQLLFIKGLSLTHSIHASLLMLITPILITFIAAWILKERLHVFTLIGLSLGIAGAVVLVTANESSGSAPQVVLGDILIIINAISYTIYFVLVKPLMNAYNPIVVTRMVFTMGLFLILPFCWTEFMDIPWSEYDVKSLTILGVIVVCGTFLAYLFNIYGIKTLGASVAGAYIYIQPVFAAVIAMIFIGEQLTVYKILAAVFIFAGVYLANKSKGNG